MKTTLAIAVFLVAAFMAGAQDTPSTKIVELRSGSSLIVAYCSQCHDWAADYDSIMASGAIVPGDSGSSPAWIMISTGRMPADGPAPSAAERKLIKDWIDAGAPAPAK
jgi:hypothetical protein